MAGVGAIRTHDGGVAAGVAAADPAGFQHRHIGDAVVLGQVVGRGQAMAAAANDDHVVAGFWLGVAPRRSPVGLTVQGGGQEEVVTPWEILDRICGSTRMAKSSCVWESMKPGATI